jgi:hypothetical protein
MKKHMLFLFFTGLVSIAQAQTKDPYLVKSLSSEAVKAVDVQTSGGSISVTGAEASQARVEVFVTGNNGKNDLSKEEIKQRLDELYTLDIAVSGGKLTAIAKSKERIKDWKRALNISFKVYVQKNVSTDLNTSGGSISISNISGDQKFATSGGSLHVENVSGKVNGRTSGGSIHLENAKDDIDLRTSGGSINALNCDGKLNLATLGGSLQLKGLKGMITAVTSGGSVDGKDISGELEASTSGGSINLKDLACSLETSTSGGNISVSMKELGKYLRINNSAGNVDLELPKGKGLDLDISGSRIRTDKLENFNGKLGDDEIEGKLNGGGVLVKVRAGSGRVSLELK